MSETVLKQDSQSAIDQQMMQRLRSAADAVAAWEVVPRPPSRSEFPRRVRAAREELKHVEMNNLYRRARPRVARTHGCTPSGAASSFR